MTDAAPAGRISEDDVAYVARLARLRLDDAELTHFTEHLAAVLDHAAELDGLELDSFPANAQPWPLRNVMRNDDPGPKLDRDEVLAAAPQAEDDAFRVPPVLGEAP